MELGGLFVPLVTPFTADGEVDVVALERLARDAVAEGAAGIVALGTTGELAVLDDAERVTVIDVCARVRRDTGAALVVGAGTSATARSATAVAELARWPEVDAALVPVPTFVRPTEAGVVEHFRELSARSTVPLIVYHVPHRTGRTLTAATLRELAGLPGVIGMKYAVQAVDADVVDLLADPPPGFAVLAGDDVVAGPLLAVGAAGAVLASAHLRTQQWAEAVASWRVGDAERARELTRPLTRLAAALFAEPNPCVLKAVLHEQGRIASPAVRLPLLAAQPLTVAAALARLSEVPAGRIGTRL
ncbi:dihydrodipicolinate synthase family protein [Pseudonocardia alaniniphila]|uniref:Dihydrodipicolinate synthase family protein n=1 Tax=Pseudonocardia alaniniphila TaxID=75291 RepID=A0ABS9TUX6_9PSEU|nr:dihydrodipicolinate synthase family protein [Pseudonocardia alaniniphila]MCH6172365.1 dihydrodipicolinate synthase family protein [Pseudonocardia alaniniphila]